MRISDWSADVCSSDLGIVARHDRPVLGTREMREPECVPEPDILILNGFVACRIRRQTGTARILVDQDRQSVVSGKSVSVRVDLGGGGSMKHNTVHREVLT